MDMNENAILVLDKIDYRENHKQYTKLILEKYKSANIYYTEYEDKLIRKVRVIPGIGKALHHLLYWVKSFNYALKIKARAEGATIICVNPLVAIFLGMMNKNSFRLIMCGFLFEPKTNTFYYNTRKKFVNYVLKGIDLVVVYARQEIDYYNKIFGNTGKFRFIKYGIDYIVDEKYSHDLPQEYLFSGGGSNRDYKTLFEAYGVVKDDLKVPLYLATLPYCVQGLDTSNINILTDVVIENFGYVMGNSEIVILSLKDTDISAGHQVMLQALSKGKPIIVNDIRAIRDYVTEDNVVFYRSGDDIDLANKIIDTYQNIEYEKEKSNKNIKLYEKEYMFNNMLERLIRLE